MNEPIVPEAFNLLKPRALQIEFDSLLPHVLRLVLLREGETPD